MVQHVLRDGSSTYCLDAIADRIKLRDPESNRGVVRVFLCPDTVCPGVDDILLADAGIPGAFYLERDEKKRKAMERDVQQGMNVSQVYSCWSVGVCPSAFDAPNYETQRVTRESVRVRGWPLTMAAPGTQIELKDDPISFPTTNGNASRILRFESV
ncbi:MAG: hypothetical protein Q7R96_00610 [Nanoarchaeota archaeon]|nr:hypothetical protein [Nanoarchaeota archaeon]